MSPEPEKAMDSADRLGGLCPDAGHIHHMVEGLGRALAVKFASRGFDLGLVSRSEEGCTAAIEAVAQKSGTARFYQADVIEPQTVESAVAKINREMGEIKLLIYNVRGNFDSCAPLDMTYEALEKNFREAVTLRQAASTSLDRTPGRIVSIAVSRTSRMTLADSL